MGYLVDSNVLIDYVAERFENNQLKALDIMFDDSLKISVITKIEILGYNGRSDENVKMTAFISYASIIDLNELVVNRTIELRRSMKIKTPDAIIAATALAYDLTLITNNVSDFKRVEGLKLFNPYNI